jgi:hypothetical protein
MVMLDYKLLISVSLGYGFILLIAFQLGFFSVVGFEYAGLIGASDIWANFGVIAGCGGAIVALLVVILIGFQVSEQSGFDVVRWIADHSSGLAATLAILSALIFAWLWYKKQLFPMMLLMVVPLTIEITVTYCNLVSYHRVVVWSAVLSVIYVIVLSYFIGFYTGFYNLVLDARRYDIWFDNSKIEGARIIRTSSFGIIYQIGRDISFANMAKIIAITPSDKTKPSSSSPSAASPPSSAPR